MGWGGVGVVGVGGGGGGGVLKGRSLTHRIAGRHYLLVSSEHRYPCMKGQGANANKPILIAGSQKSTDPLNMFNRLNLAVKERFGDRYDFLRFDEWKSYDDYEEMQTDSLFFWKSPQALSKCFSRRAEAAGFPKGYMTAHGLSKWGGWVGGGRRGRRGRRGVVGLV